MRVEGEPVAEENGVFYLLRDHLGSASVTLKEDSGALTKYAELRYKPWGEDRPASDAFNETQSPSERRFTGQRAHDELGLCYYKARWYDPALGRFVQPDSIVPESQGVQAWDRYAHVNNSPTNYADPSGHKIICGVSRGSCGSSISPETHAQTIPSAGAEPSNQSLTPPIQPIIPPIGLILPNSSYPSTDPSGFSDPALEAWMLFWEKVASPSFDMVDAYDIYNLTSKSGWKAIRYSLPTGLVEGSVESFRQYYRDSWYQSLTPLQRTARAIIVGGETLATDYLAGMAGGTGAVIGGAVLGPLGAAAGYLGGNTLVTEAGDRAWAHYINQGLIQEYFRLGVWP